MPGDPSQSDLPEELLAEFHSAARGALGELRALLAGMAGSAELTRIGRVAHQLAGSAGSYGFEPISKAAKLVEKSVATELPRRLEKLIAELEKTVGSAPLESEPVGVQVPEPIPVPPPPPAPTPPPIVERGEERILLGEDDSTVVALVRDRLEREGYRVDHFANGNDVVAAAARHGYRLIVLDAKLPGLEGFDVLSRLRADPRHLRTPILFLTALTGSQDAVRAFDLGADDYVRKPFSPAELVARIRNLLARRTP